MLILGITDGQTSGAAVCRGSEILAAVNEERLVRMKQARGFPRASIPEVLRLAGVRHEDLDAVAVAQVDMRLNETVREWRGWFEERGRSDSANLFFKVASAFGGLVPALPLLEQAYYGVRTPQYAQRRRRIRKIVREEYSINAPVTFHHHHLCHAASAFYTSGFDEATVVSMDGGGDGDSSHIYHGTSNGLTRLGSSSAYDSLGNYYAYVTHLCGYKAKKHEGKITGLAAHGRPVHRELLERFIALEDGGTRNRGRVLFNSALRRLSRELPTGWSHADLAASIQELSEDIVAGYCRHWARRTGSHNIALAGGIFANVRINQVVHELPEIARVFVFPGMSDEGLAVGAALQRAAELGAGSGSPLRPSELPHVYLGTSYEDTDIEAALKAEGLDYHKSDSVEVEIARHLADGWVVARFNGPMEFGPRALGNRSILFTPTDRSVNDWLNHSLNRTEFMPFAPAVLHEQVGRCFEDVDGSAHTAEFMTITYACTPWMREACPGVVHIDGTARPQLVRPDTNASFYRIISEFEALTGLPCIINTSFNRHEEPIVRSPADAVGAFLASRLDWLAIGDYVVRSPHGPVHEPVPVRRAD